MSKSVVTASEKELDEPLGDFVLDFLYNDARRVGSFLAQFGDEGTLERVIQRETASTTRKRGFKLNLSGGATVMGTGGSGGVGIERGPSEEGSEGLERQFDPLWANALTLLDYLEAREMISRDLQSAGIGQFVEVSGTLRIYDLGTLQRLWDVPMIRQMMGGEISNLGNRTERRRAEATGRTARANLNPVEIGIEILKTLPHGIVARMTTSQGDDVWSSLQPSSVTGSTSDLFLKHGGNIAGTWSMIGVLDAEPDPEARQEPPVGEEAELQNAIGFMSNGFGHILDTMAPIARTFLGRPFHAYGMTPLVIYREVAG